MTWALAFQEFTFRKLKYLVYIVVALSIYGMVIEILQGAYVEDRSADFWDWVANSLGIMFGLVLFHISKSRIQVKR